MVCPIISGRIIERRDQVLITLWVPFSFCASTFLSRWSSTKGAFFWLRGMLCPYSACDASSAALAGLAAADDLGVGGLALARAALGLAPWGHRVATTRG